MKLSRRSLLALFGTALAGAGCAKFKPPHVRVEEYRELPIRVACVGDSITYGAGIEDRENKNYPKQLGDLLGTSFEVRNFGRSGATLLKAGDLPYWTTDEFKSATAYQPHVVILKLGTNDTKPQNWKGKEVFEADLKALLDHFLALKSRPRPKIWVCLPVPIYGEQWGINSKNLEEGVIPVLMDVCQRRNIPVIDLNDALTGHPEMFPDKIHPNAAGATLMARTIYQAIRP